jgi:hypothetical protein
MQNKEPERADPSGYAFGVKCSATVERKATTRRNVPTGMLRSRSDLVSQGKPTFLHEKAHRDDARMFWIGI